MKPTDPQIEIYRKLAPWQKLAAARELYWFAREIIRKRIMRANPGITTKDLEKKIRSFM